MPSYAKKEFQKQSPIPNSSNLHSLNQTIKPDNFQSSDAINPLQAKADNSSRVTQLKLLQLKADQYSQNQQNAPIQRKGDEFIGNPARHHMHINIGQPHYKDGKSRSSRMEIGHFTNYKKDLMEDVIDFLKPRAAEDGAQACIDWCITQCRLIKQESK